VEKARVHKLLILQEKAQYEIKIAQSVQIGFLPKCPPEVPGYEFFNYYNPALTVGGDYYDYFLLQNGRVVVVLGDVAGKGVPAAMLMAKLSAEARFAFLTQTEPSQAIATLNQQLIAGGIGERFVTLVAMVIDPVTNAVVIVNAGHQTPYRYSARSQSFELCVAEPLVGIPIGIMAEMTYHAQNFTLNPGESIVVFTDGVTDAVDPQGKMFELEGVIKTVTGDPGIKNKPTPDCIGQVLSGAVKRHANGAPQADDIALVCYGRISEALDPVTNLKP
jgi:serine phosphatase RsbU (regulator of sigma subunit)